MGFENHSRPGLIEVASKIAIKYHVTFNIKQKEFIGDADRVAKAVTALDKWTNNERVFQRGARDA